MQEPPNPARLDYHSAPNPGPNYGHKTARALKYLAGPLIIAGALAVLLPALGKPRPEAQISKCQSNLKGIASALVAYANQNHGVFPNRLEELIVSRVLPKEWVPQTQIFICPESGDTPILGSEASQVHGLSAGGHLSYIYLGGAMTAADFPPDGVLVLEPLANHHGRGINVLFGDFHVEFLDSHSAEVLLRSITRGKPLIRAPKR